ncbi:alpha/beta-hydrolase [Auricularia subglabra TFB-10046 SS5]|uniref:Alpha/beta-hydrolase n=1 Tax=Auricularia subglabra (strain TFB-10046 / SS5) TaxID=717982 RepID=J0LE33_AURST|nr:alpha/beta-hydrolase [Auricularia subglabra TFB-10046 SS5]
MICEDCTKGYELPGEPRGTFPGGYGGAYLAPHPATKRAVVLFTDVFGFALNNPKLLADELARRRPPFGTEELEPYTSPVPGGAKRTLWGQIKRHAFFASKIPAMYSVRPQVFLAKIKRDRGYEIIGVVGYCFGGSLALRMTATDLIQGAVIAHPGGAPLDLVNAIKIPTIWICAEEDEQFPAEERDTAQRALASRDAAPPHEFIIYPGTTHGFAGRPALQYPLVKDAFESAFAKTVEFLHEVVNKGDVHSVAA